MTAIKGRSTMTVTLNTTSEDVKKFLLDSPSGKFSIHTYQGDRPWESNWSEITVSWEYDLDEREAEDRREMMGT